MITLTCIPSHVPSRRALIATCLVFAFHGSAIREIPAQDEPTGPVVEHSPGYPVIDYRAATPAEGYARGLSEIIRARGAYNLMSAEALKDAAEAAREQMRNREEWTHTYFRMRQANESYRDKEQGPRPTTEDIVRYAQMGKPERLSPGEIDLVTGTIYWPEVLEGAEFAESREKLEDLFANWIEYGNLSLEHRQEIRRTIDVMLAMLEDQIRELPPPDYMTGKRFLESLSYEAHLAAG